MIQTPAGQPSINAKCKVKTEEGKEIQHTEYFFGYKAHVSLIVGAGMITSLEVTSGKAYDGHHSCSSVDHYLQHNLAIKTYGYQES